MELKKVIDAIVKKAEKVCPESLALIGVYGSMMTGDTHPKSDIDLLIVINDDDGWQLGKSFIDEALQIGQDLYCTTWESLEEDAKYHHPHISKLMDASIEYYADAKYVKRLEALRMKAKTILEKPFIDEDYEKIMPMLKASKEHMANAIMSDCLSEVRFEAAQVIIKLQQAVMLTNKKYFKLGAKRALEEIENLERKPKDFLIDIDAMIRATSIEKLKENVINLMKNSHAFFEQIKEEVSGKQEEVIADKIRGSYEEMYSNWKNKMHVATQLQMPYLAFMSMVSLNEMILDIASDCAISKLDVMKYYHPNNLLECELGYDSVLEEYLKEYQKVGLQVSTYQNMELFLQAYVGEEKR